MSARINESTQYTDPATGKLLVDGFIYIGENGLDAKLNPITIYSDRALTVPIPNPQRTGSDGRAVNKIWVAGQYSLVIEDFENVQKLSDLSLGSIPVTGNLTLVDVVGADLIVATSAQPAASLVDKQVYILTAVATNTGAMTLTIDAFLTYPILKHHDVNMEAGDVELNQVLALTWNATDSVFELFTNSAAVPLDVIHTQTALGVKTFTDGIVSDVTGNVTGDVTGNSGTTTKLATARTVGGVSFDGSANINLAGVNTAGNQNTSGVAASITSQGSLATLNSVGAAQIDAGAVASEYAATGAGAVGSFALARNTAGTAKNFGDTIAGSDLATTNVASTATGTVPSGTWRSLGSINTGTSEGLTVIWLRIS